MKRIITILFVFFLASPLISEAQSKKRFRPKQRFEMGLMLGVNLSQIDGDDFVGYDKAGLSGGIEGVVLLTRRMNGAMQLLYNQKGARVHDGVSVRQKKSRMLQLDYMEVPILIRYQLNQPDEFQKAILTFEGGISYGKLINTIIEEEVNRLPRTFTAIEPDFNRNEFSLIAGLSVKIFDHANLGIRGTSALSRLYKDEAVLNKNVTAQDQITGRIRPYAFLRNYSITLYARYDLY